jgi:catecholate siderophore receptor
MTRRAGHSVQRLVPAKMGFVSMAALLCLSAPTKLAAQPATTELPGPVAQQTPQEPQAPATPATTPETRLRPVSVSTRTPRQAPAQPRPTTRRTAPQTTTQRTPPPSVWTGALQAGSAGTVGYLATRTISATKTDTPLINVPQSATVLTKEFIQDQPFQAFTEVLRYAPGVIPHQGEGNRDQVVIRGMSSSADFFVNGIRDDVQYFRDLYNIYRVEVLKGPNAMIFGRGGAGGVVNRVLKEADGVPVKELTVLGGQFNDQRVAVDVGDSFNQNVAGRLNAVYENSDSYRKFVNIQRYGINPTAVFRTDDTKIALSYEYFHDNRTSDRGIPSQAIVGPGKLLPYLTDPSTFFGNPNLSHNHVDANIATATIEHDFDSGLKIKNASRYASYDKFYQNVYPGGAVNVAGTSVNLTAYNHETDRQNGFNQTDLTYKIDSGWIRQTLLAGLELGHQTGIDVRNDGFFNNNSLTLAVSPLNPVSFTPIVFRYNGGTNSSYKLGLAAVYAQDQIEVTKYLQFITGLRFDRFDFTATDRGTGATQARIDKLLSPRAGVILKPVENVSFYGSYSVSYLPSSGDQFATLTPGTAISEPEKFVNREVGVKWEASPRLTFTTAVFDLDRFNQRFPDPNNPGFFILSGKTNAKGFEAGVVGQINDLWQISAGYAYTDARIVSNTSAIIVAGNRVGLVPYNTFTMWNRYQFTDTFAAGVGIIHQTSSYASSDDTVVLPGWTRVDAGIFGNIDRKYLPPEIKRLRWQVNVENLFDTRYYSSADGNNNISPGSPRAVRGQMIANF